MEERQRKGQQNGKKQKNALSVGQVKDVNNRMIFKNPILCTQFLRGYVDIPVLKDVQPEDIEDVTRKYQAYLGISFEMDTVKKIRIRQTEKGDYKSSDMPLYMVSLIEHKSQVDYNVAMQLLRYMTCIWYEYGKEREQNKKGISSNKNFRYPPILPIVYYEGSDAWTAGLRLKDRIMMSDVFGDYLPDFTYKLIRIHDYKNEELLGREDEMSLLMMVNKVQSITDIKALWENVQKDKIDRIIQNTQPAVLEIIESIVWSLLMKMNVPVAEAKIYVKKIKEREMGYWFENMEKMDIQAERRNTAEARREAEELKKKLIEAEEKIRELEKNY